MWARSTLNRCFAVNKAFTKHLDNVGSRIRTRTAASEMGKLQSFLKESATAGTLNEKISKIAPRDQEFNEFLQKFRENNKEYSNVIDLSRFYDENNPFRSQEKLRQDELDMLMEFEKRHSERANTVAKSELERGFQHEPGQYLYEKNMTFHPLHYTRDSKFMHIILQRRVTTQVTTLNRINHFNYLIFAGNNDGIIGYGKGKGLDFEGALRKAFIDLKKNLIALDIRPENTFPLEIKTQFCRYFMKVEPISSYSSWGSPIFGQMIQLAGLENVRFNMNKRNQNYHNMVDSVYSSYTPT